MLVAAPRRQAIEKAAEVGVQQRLILIHHHGGGGVHRRHDHNTVEQPKPRHRSLHPIRHIVECWARSGLQLELDRPAPKVSIPRQRHPAQGLDAGGPGAEHHPAQGLNQLLGQLAGSLLAAGGRAKHRTGDPDHVGAESQRHRRLQTGANASACNERQPRQPAAHLDEAVRGRRSPPAECRRDVPQRSSQAMTLDLAPRRSAGAGDVDRVHARLRQPNGVRLADAEADLLGDHRQTQRPA